MDKIETQKSTTELDIPHAGYSLGYGVCRCGRSMADPIHQDEALPEIAAANDIVVTEKGS